MCVHSLAEIDYYEKCLNIDRKKLEFVKLGIADDSIDYKIEKPKFNEEVFLLSVGNSNRDFKFIEESLKGQRYNVKLFSGMLSPHTNQNIVCSGGISVSEYYEQLSKCFCVILALKNPDISSGQLVLLQSYSFGKPVIITRTNSCKEYISDSCTFTIEKDKEELIEAINSLLNDEKKYNELSLNAKNVYKKEFTIEAMAKGVSIFFK